MVIVAGLSWLTTLLYLAGKVAITQAFSGIYMYTSELFPTHARHSLLGFCSTVGRVGSIVAPQMPLLVRILHLTTYTVCGEVDTNRCVSCYQVSFRLKSCTESE